MLYSNTVSQKDITLKIGICPRSFDVYRDDQWLGCIFYGVDRLWSNSGDRIDYAKREDAIAAIVKNPKRIEPTIIDGIVVPF